MKFTEGTAVVPSNFGSIYRPKRSYYGTPHLSGCYWDKCRETFHARVDSAVKEMIKSYFFYARDTEKVAEFIWRVEDRLGVAHSEFQKTNDNSIMLVTPSPWWREDRLRHNFYSIVLRCSERFYYKSKQQLMDVLMNSKYLLKTRYAVERFLDGYTCSVKNRSAFSGSWVHYFSLGGFVTPASVERNLLKPV